MITIHQSGQGADKLEVISWWNGGAYAIQFGEAGSPMLTLWFQGDDAIVLRDEYEAREAKRPKVDCRGHWLATLDPYLP